MKTPKYEELIIPERSTMEEAMRSIDQHGLGFVLLGDGLSPRALLTDGDVRRALLSGSTISSPASDAGNYKFVFAATKDHPSKIAELLSRYSCVPILDSNHELAEVAFKNRLGVIPVYEPMLGQEEWANLRQCIETGWISSSGNFVKQFEEMIADFLGAPQTVLTVSNGTVALELCMRTLGIGPGDEVIVPDLTFIATANAVANVGAIPVPVDVDFNSGLMDIHSATEAITSRTRAIIPVHLYGRPLDIDELRERISDKKIFIIEDCAEAFGTSLQGRHVGTLGDAAAFSFFGNKNITTGEGGAVLFRDRAHSELGFAKRGHGFSSASRRESITQGSNMRMTNLQAAIGVAQMTKIQEILNLKSTVSSFYRKTLEGDPELILPKWNSNENGVDWLYTVGLGDFSDTEVESLLSTLANKGIEVRREFLPISRQTAFHGQSSKNQNAHQRSQKFICLPSSPNLSEDNLERVANELLNGINVLRKLRC